MPSAGALASAHLTGWSPSPRRTCDSLGRTCRRTSSRPRGGAADTQCRSCTPYTASCRSGSHTPARCSCPSRMGGLKITQTDLHAQNAREQSTRNNVYVTHTHTDFKLKHLPKHFLQDLYSTWLYFPNTHSVL